MNPSGSVEYRVKVSGYPAHLSIPLLFLSFLWDWFSPAYSLWWSYLPTFSWFTCEVAGAAILTCSHQYPWSGEQGHCTHWNRNCIIIIFNHGTLDSRLVGDGGWAEHGPGDLWEGHWADERPYVYESYYHGVLILTIIAEFFLHSLTGILPCSLWVDFLLILLSQGARLMGFSLFSWQQRSTVTPE